MNKEYVFIGNAQNKTRDFINQIIKENQDLQHQLEEKDRVINEAVNYIKEKIEINNLLLDDYDEVYYEYLSQESVDKLLEILERGKDGK